MASLAITSEPEGLQQMCRLCLSEESLHGIWETQDLHQWISDYLSIMVSTGDRMSQSICTICQIRISEFHHFRMSCQEVQSVLQTMLEDDHMKREEVSLSSVAHEQQPEQSGSEEGSRLDSDHSEDIPASIERHAKVYYEEMRDEQLADQLVVEEIKVESRTGEETESFSLGRSPVIAEKDATKDSALKCEICNKLYLSKQKLLIHKKASHGKKDHNCTVCGVGFPYRGNLITHFKTEQHLFNAKLLYDTNPMKFNEFLMSSNVIYVKGHPG